MATVLAFNPDVRLIATAVLRSPGAGITYDEELNCLLAAAGTSCGVLAVVESDLTPKLCRIDDFSKNGKTQIQQFSHRAFNVTDLPPGFAFRTSVYGDINPENRAEATGHSVLIFKDPTQRPREELEIGQLWRLSGEAEQRLFEILPSGIARALPQMLFNAGLREDFKPFTK